MSETNYPLTWHHISKEWSPQSEHHKKKVTLNTVYNYHLKQYMSSHSHLCGYTACSVFATELE